MLGMCWIKRPVFQPFEVPLASLAAVQSDTALTMVVVPGAPGGGWARVALDWAELDPEHAGPAVIRRVWAPTIPEALDAMVADRRTDAALEQIEHGAAAEGAEWPDL